MPKRHAEKHAEKGSELFSILQNSSSSFVPPPLFLSFVPLLCSSPLFLSFVPRPLCSSDANYNVTAAVDDSTDAVVERYNYTPYGTPTVLDANFAADSDQVSDIGNTHLYTGRERDPETGLQLNRHRYYASHLGRWTTRDPIGYDAGSRSQTAGKPGLPSCRWESARKYLTFSCPVSTLKLAVRETDVAAGRSFQ
jgi:RHS repeat-associated protein